MRWPVYLSLPCFLLGISILCCCEAGAKKKQNLEIVYDIKQFKKLLRTRTNVLVIFMKTSKDGSKVIKNFNEAAEMMKGKATVCSVDCSEAGKLCKKTKMSPNPFLVQHYKDGEFHKAYDRAMTTKSIVGFLEDPTGDIPWDEEKTARDVLHISAATELQKLVFKSKKPILAMFYTPWCGHCKRLKPEFAAAATEVLSSAVLVGINCDKPALSALRQEFNITGYPTIFYFRGGKLVHRYSGGYDKAGILSWLENPSEPKEPEKEEAWADQENDVNHLTTNTFDDFMSANPSVLVMFYAPWCGHCKAMKPDYENAATILEQEASKGKIAAVDATESRNLGEKFNVKGFPTVIYFKEGQQMWTISERTTAKIVEFMKNPQEPPPPPAAEVPWADMEGDVVHLTNENFLSTLKKKKHALVMFYAPWCGHCKKAKPHFTEAAAKFTDDPKKVFAAVDCTEHADICSKYDVSGYPTFKYIKYGKNEEPYNGGREEASFVAFMTNPENPAKVAPPSVEDMWADAEGAENVVRLTEGNFDQFVSKNPSVMVMFYAPWCGHCKRMKPDYAAAATHLLQEGISGVFAAVDATKHPAISSKYDVEGFPTLKYFKDGKLASEFNKRDKDVLIEFMVASAPALSVSDGLSTAYRLSSENFDRIALGSPSLMVLLYSQTCEICEESKQNFDEAAAIAKSEKLEGEFGMIDCTKEEQICASLKPKGFPTAVYLQRGTEVLRYAELKGDAKALISFIKRPLAEFNEEPGNTRVGGRSKSKKAKSNDKAKDEL